MKYTDEKIQKKLMALMPSPEECSDPYNVGYANAILAAYQVFERYVCEPLDQYELFISFYYFGENKDITGIGNCCIKYFGKVKEYKDITELENLVCKNTGYSKVIILNYKVLGVE